LRTAGSKQGEVKKTRGAGRGFSFQKRMSLWGVGKKKDEEANGEFWPRVEKKKMEEGKGRRRDVFVKFRKTQNRPPNRQQEGKAGH